MNVLENLLAKSNKYNATASSTYTAQGGDFSIAYDDVLLASGVFSIDTVTVSPTKMDHMNTQWYVVHARRSVELKSPIKHLVNALTSLG